MIKTSMKDCRGKESRTLFFVTVAYVVVIAKFVLSGLDIGFGAIPVMSGIEFAAALGAALGVWRLREHTEKNIYHRSEITHDESG